MILHLLLLEWFMFIYSFETSTNQVVNLWNYPLLPDDFDTLVESSPLKYNADLNSNLTPRKIPRQMWISFKIVPDENSMSSHVMKSYKNEPKNGWKVHLFGHEEQVEFMRKYYHNTSLLWAFEQIHPFAGAAMSDIWRYAVLYAFGGFYIDDDSFISISAEEAVQENDTFILSQEGHIYHDNCYINGYHLSHYNLSKTYQFNEYGNIFGGRILINWGMFSIPKHFILYNVMKNLVEIIRSEYLRENIIWQWKSEPRWKVVHCATGPRLLTATIHELTIQRHDNLNIRMIEKDFKQFGGEFTLREYRKESMHYMLVMNKLGIPLLSNYTAFDTTKLHNRPVTNNQDNGIYRVYNGKKSLIPDMDTFHALNYTTKDIIHLWETENFINIPEGDIIEKMDFVGPDPG